MYRQLSDEELGRYVAFCVSPGGHRFETASVQAIDKAMTDASMRLGRRMAGEIATRSPPRVASPMPLVGA